MAINFGNSMGIIQANDLYNDAGGGMDWYDNGDEGDEPSPGGGEPGGGEPGGGEPISQEPIQTDEPIITNIQPSETDEISEIIITAERPSQTETEEISEIIISTDRPTYSIDRISVTDMTLPPIPTDTEEISEIIITAERPTHTETEEISEIIITAIRPSQTQTQTETLTISVTDMTLPPLPTETDTIPEIIITTDRPTQSPTETVTLSLTESITPIIPTETDTIPEIIITTDRPTQSETETVTLSFSETESITFTAETPSPTETETESESLTPITPTPTISFSQSLPPPPPPTPTFTNPPPPPPSITSIVPQTQGEMINPGWIQPQAFYNTTNDAQSKFFWGGHGPQFSSGGANPFNAQAYNQVAAPNTPWGRGQIMAPLSPEEVQQAIAGTYQQRPGTAPATRVEAYRPQTMTAPQYGQVQISSIAPGANVTTPSKTTSQYTAEQTALIAQTLGSDWQARQQKAALDGDYSTLVEMQRQIDAILNPSNEVGGTGGGD